MIRVTRPGGLVYLSYTVWLSPWGGHESAPFHYLGGNYALRRYIRRHGRKPKNVFGETMFPLGVGQVLSLVRRRADVTVVEARPRYYPRWCRFLIYLPGLRELLTWNLLVILAAAGVTTPRLPLEEIFSDQPELRRRRKRPPRRRGVAGERPPSGRPALGRAGVGDRAGRPDRGRIRAG